MKREFVIESIRGVLRKYGIKRAFLFGSFARNERSYRDIDLAIEPPPRFSLFDMAGVQVELEDAIKKGVDIVTLRSLSPRLMGHIKKDLTAVL